MKGVVALLLLVSLFQQAASQSVPKQYAPTEIRLVDLSLKKQSELEKRDKLLAKEAKKIKEQKELNVLLQKYDETVESIWDVIGGGCSWYCGGGNYLVKASSSIDGTNGIDYSSKSADDFSYRTAWVVNKGNAGIGEYIEYYFKNNSPCVTKIIISNGYMKSDELWKNNNRVKKMRVAINGVIKGVLNLQDSKSDQVFELGTLGHNKNGADLILRFEIVEVYKGNKYNDTAITEIYFDGVDVH
ncbi:NADase-type glycan-binding domain-containing protein [Hymenobacter guriensis]|uniref:NAD glycohydrolase translocation F5/8 type C domain-containing protein n=1 Tax=Hymenobacter guriensis TaxID=2793065 RepID=A0ABS0L5F9_9BACT|nr:hypothetical protein [Hymenobacter guriensis]MBG8555385.1 hypothetical protein [Hymenobacter guriensis]